MSIQDKNIVPEQIPLPFYQTEKKTFENFYPTSNTLLLKCLKQFIDDKTFTNPIYIWGHRGVGCSHLLEACYHKACSQNIKVIYIQLQTLQDKDLSCYLKDLSHYELVCIDGLERIAGQLAWEETLLHTYNNLMSKQTALLFCAHQVPNRLNFKLADLVSRLKSGLIFQVQSLDDTNKIFALQRRAELRGFILPDVAARFLLSRWARNEKALFNALEKLDYSSLIYQRKLTVPFLKQILNL